LFFEEFELLFFFVFYSPLAIGATVEVNIDVDKCENVTILEHVVANVSFSFHRRGDVKITLISPSGTPSEMISYRDNDASDKGIYYQLVLLGVKMKIYRHVLLMRKNQVKRAPIKTRAVVVLLTEL
jgi:hypothetical protein